MNKSMPFLFMKCKITKMSYSDFPTRLQSFDEIYHTLQTIVTDIAATEFLIQFLKSSIVATSPKTGS